MLHAAKQPVLDFYLVNTKVIFKTWLGIMLKSHLRSISWKYLNVKVAPGRNEIEVTVYEQICDCAGKTEKNQL